MISTVLMKTITDLLEKRSWFPIQYYKTLINPVNLSKTGHLLD